MEHLLFLVLLFFYGSTWLRQDFARPAIANDFLQKSLAQGLDVIDEADYAREKGIAIFTIGFGKEAPESKDPYQQMSNHSDYGPHYSWEVSNFYLPKYFLHRVANSRECIDGKFPNFPKDIGGCSENVPVGKYFHVTDYASLHAAMDSIITTLRLDTSAGGD